MACTRKSSLPHGLRSAANTSSTEALSSTSHGSTSDAPTFSASGFTRRPNASPW